MIGHGSCQCGWASPPTTEPVAKFLAVAHVAHRHPDLYESTVGKTSAEFRAGLQPNEAEALAVAEAEGLL